MQRAWSVLQYVVPGTTFIPGALRIVGLVSQRGSGKCSQISQGGTEGPAIPDPTLSKQGCCTSVRQAPNHAPSCMRRDLWRT